ncbi:protein-export chaperone SecB [Luteimonas abyssi]|uniref:protein-export chaperone SecB n=1 Tax=Luteimonas abyssi TaxID=1247514 RepID=UPI0009E70972|nr:protein-export chaperone SecB [Luteimonas abyssi]
MSQGIESVLIFEDYTVKEMVFERNYDFNLEERSNEVSLEFAFESSAQYSDNKDKAVLTLSCKVFEEDFSINDVPFHLRLTVVGYFRCEGDVNIENFQMNGMAILLPYLRSLITSFTSQAGVPPVIMPPINVYNAYNHGLKEDF